MLKIIIILGTVIVFSVGLFILFSTTPQKVYENRVPTNQSIADMQVSDKGLNNVTQIATNSTSRINLDEESGPSGFVSQLKIYLKYGNTITSHPGESYLSIAKCDSGDRLVGGGIDTNNVLVNQTNLDMPNGFQKDAQQWVVNGYVDPNGSTSRITSVAFCTSNQ